MKTKKIREFIEGQKTGGRRLTMLKLPAAIGGLILLSIIFLFTFYSDMQKEMDRQISVNLREMTEQVGQAVNAEMDTYLQAVNALGSFIENFEESINYHIEDLMSVVAAQTSISRFSLFTEDGWIYNSGAFESAPSNYKYVNMAMENGESVTSVFYSSLAKDSAIAIYKPLYNAFSDESLVLCGTILLTDLKEIISFSGFDGEGYSYVVQKNGDVIALTEHPNRKEGQYNIFRMLESAQQTSISFAQLKENMENGLSGYMNYELNGESKKLYYEPVGFQDWYIVSVAPEQVFISRAENLENYALQLAVKITLLHILVFLIACIWFWRSNDYLKRAHMQVLKSNKRYEIAMLHSNFKMLEYDLNIDQVLFLSEDAGSLLQFPPGKVHSNARAILQERLTESSFQLVQDFVRNLTAGEDLHECEVEFRDGHWVHLSAAEVDEDVQGIFLGTVIDITHKKELEAQYLQEEQLFKAILREALSGFSADLENGEILNSFRNGMEQPEQEIDKATMTDALLTQMCQVVHEEDRFEASKLFNMQAFKDLHDRGQKDISSYFRMILPTSGEMIWVHRVIHFLMNPVNGHRIIFTYVKNVDNQRRESLEIAYASERDDLTGLYNRNAFVKRANMLFENAEGDQQYALMMMDLDFFKAINDTYGHQAGDRLLCQIAEILKKEFPQPDIVARLGGDEFIAVTDCINREDILHHADRICRSIEEIRCGDVACNTCTISIGIAFVKTGDCFEMVYPQADQALYQAKREGKNRVIILSE